MQFGGGGLRVLGRRGGDARQAHVFGERRGLRWLQQGRERLQCEQSADGDRHRLRCTRPSDSNSAHPPLSLGGGNLSPLGRQIAQATDWRIASMSRSWSSTQSPGLWEKMIRRSSSAHWRLRSGSIVSARWIASACSWMSKGLTEIT